MMGAYAHSWSLQPFPVRETSRPLIGQRLDRGTNDHMPLLVLLVLALTVGFVVGLVAWRYPRIARPSPAPTLATARKIGETVGRHPSLRAALDARLDPAAATGLALTLALVFAIGGGVLFGVLAYLVRTNSHLIGIDNSLAKWGNRHASAISMHVLNVVTQLGGIYTVIVLCVVLAVAETIRERSVWVTPFIVAVMAGEEILTATVKQLAGRLRPTFNPAAATLGPSFPSGHSATAAAFYATAALLLGRRRGRPARAVLTGLAAGIAVAVAASRVLLDVHWLTDVIAGLALGWAWFAVSAIAFGGRILRFGAAAETAARVADATEVVGASSDSAARRPAVSARSPDASK
jgi:membrane-associated phospholipid phosphatase